MEWFLNIAWALLTASMGLLWLRYGSRGTDRRAQVVTLFVLLLILFPVVSVSDDLVSLHNPAEADCCQRRDHVVAVAHFELPAIADVPLPVVADPPSGAPRRPLDWRNGVTLAEDHPALAAIENRPPPAA